MLEVLLEQRKVRTVDVELAALLVDEQQPPYSEGFYIILLLLKAMHEQHTCLDLHSVNWDNPFELDTRAPVPAFFAPDFDAPGCLNALPCTGAEKPLRIHGQRVYLARYDGYEAQLTARFLQLAKQPLELDLPALKALLAHYFNNKNSEPDWQKVACALAATSKFCVITGGPGTGKTTTVTRLLAILQSLYAQAPLHIELVAPTGKAAARLSESIQGAKGDLAETDQAVLESIPEQAQTLHRLLGTVPMSNHFRHHRGNPVHADLVIVDEASMVDISLMSKLVDALAPHTRLILLGDKDQLSSVDTGNIMADICSECALGQLPHYSDQRAEQLGYLCGEHSYHSGQQSPYALTDHVAFLQHSYRFDGDSGIGQLAYAINTADSKKARYLLQSRASDISYYPLDEGFYSALIARCAEQYSHYLALIAAGATPAQVHDAFARFQLLAALREGPFGVHALNQRIEYHLAQQGKINVQQRFYIGMPLMITQNDYQLNLFNGDIGIIMADDNGEPQAVFMGAQGEARAFYPGRLPQFDKVFAMTIHKSQGSEFAHTAMVLPPLHRGGRRLNRQLVYTGVTRAKAHIELICDARTLAHAIATPVRRASGLYQRLCEC
ncbi:exodeoxyribonuclease V subunit alpha [Pseudoalteromonas ruthenica]|uniref:exodeoxyribonuclease V subunit alpha n=1 Tax=Pseudoalteromonas ruthenica TaxID=151081 RepID=UPI00110A3B7C|nr:exodeoxyribonuclease V subunit alpha [Pseudoalteromonas ruthenica]TMO49005.1 exodeoxyribonuclease V subunit alpha [Pseudoalteromonas ruthenica]TMO51134.1 exodeoxyribonuclease V subunit alpha [Pseudoalteromonas ruthenica]